MNILLSGISGYMGREVVKLCENGYRGATLSAGVDPRADAAFGVPTYHGFEENIDTSGIDCIVDFSHHAATEALTDFAVKNKLPLVIATTGHTDEELALIENASKSIPLFHSGNMSLGIALLVELAKITALALPEAEIEIIEKHHDRKIDAPSGTALMLANSIKEIRPEATYNLGRSGHGKRTPEEIGIHSIRMGNIVGEHEVIIGTPNQTITLKHEAHDRALFAEGALAAAAFIVNAPEGLYNMQSLISSDDGAENDFSAVIG